MKDKVEVRLSVGRKFLEEFEARVGASSSEELVRSALTLLDWASSEAAQGRVILSSTEEGDDIRRLVMPELVHAQTEGVGRERVPVRPQYF